MEELDEKIWSKLEARKKEKIQDGDEGEWLERVKELQTQWGSEKEMVAKLEKEVGAVREELTKANEQLVNAESAQKSLQDKIDSNKATHTEALERMRCEYEAKTSELSKKILETETTLSECQTKFEALQSECAAHVRELRRNEELIEQRGSRIQELELGLKDVTEQKQREIVELRAEHQTALLALSGEKTKLLQEYEAKHAEEIKEIENKNSELESAKLEYTSTMTELRKENSDLLEKSTNEKAEINRLYVL